MIQQTKDAISRVEAFLDERAKSRSLDQERIHAPNDNELLASDLRHLIEALASPIGALFDYSQWLDAQSLIVGEAPLTDDSGNETGETDDRSHEQLVRDYLEEA